MLNEKNTVWKDTVLGIFISIQRGHDLPEQNRNSGEIPIIGSFGITGFHNKSIAQGPGVTIGRSGASMGVVSYSDKNYWPLNTVLYVTDFHDNDPKFVYYRLKTIDFTIYNSGSAQPSLNRNYIYSVPLCIPNKNEQRAIAATLSALDDKIEINNRINKTLEEMAQALFKRWFVDFEFPDENGLPYKSSGGEMEESGLGPIPKGWKVESLDSIADYLNGLAMQKYRPEGEEFLPVIKIRELNQGKPDGQSDKASPNIDSKYIVNDGDVLFSWSGSLDVKIWCGGKGGLNQHLFKVTSDRYEKWFYYLWTKHHLEKFRGIAQDKATTMGHIQRKHLKESLVDVPAQDVLGKINSIMRPIFDLYITREIEAATLVAIRDTLLPKLISGEIRMDSSFAEDIGNGES